MERSLTMNPAEEFRQEFNCPALSSCTIESPDIKIPQYTVYLQKTLTMIEVDHNDFVTALQMHCVTKSHLYLPFYYKRYPVNLE